MVGMKRTKWSTSPLEIISSLVIALILVWSVAHAVPATVHSAAGLRDVAFGWPFPWYHQDLSRYVPVSFPENFVIVGDRVDPLPTTVDVLALVGNVLITAVVLWLIMALLIVLLRPSITRALAARGDGATMLVGGEGGKS